ncbi:succinylglutamate desuccinylase/aspartoacylase domain-containing protein [Halogeometricum luteum]|uniref:Succinylglutamate desuccinylase/aspartoacylase family protein n=1 Tax=Halogeometricum luteum TaxID=2950537 RepID=A0ABU2G1Z6_9EURY|nr:succinylglutamate desuccinylase/aspartoacylase family protein [Halogeometricum sp. S3BR5-2]MDS0294798.1 succinylglutamate desuccinylase/aspartoacylase family protein [Halogeometricum sp. S3BR5-2]
MRIYELGEGTPEVAVIGSIHGDEPCGARAVERFVAAEPAVERPVKLIVANEEALDAGVRYLDEDLNRAFPGDANADSHEGRLAADLVREVRGCTTLALHSTQSYAKPFALVGDVDAVSRSICPHLPIDELVETGDFAGGRLIDHAHTVEVECGLQGSADAEENAYWVIRSFLAATGVVSAPVDDEESPITLGTREDDRVTVYRMLERIPKEPAETYEVFVNNFELVEEGDRFAAADDRTFTADRPFYPVLLSAYGYEDVFGYAADRIGTLD